MKKVALITGAAAGIGAAISRRLAKDGIAVAVLDILIDDAQKVADEINAAGGEAMAVEASIADRAQVNAAVAAVRAKLGSITILVNNAGITGFVPFMDMTDDQWETMLKVNLQGTFIVTQVVAPDMIAAGWGRIVNISSSSAQSGSATMTHYSASKGGMIALTKSLALELGEFGITVNNIPPRLVMGTVMSEKSKADGNIDRFNAMAESGAVRRAGRPEDIAGACAWLVSDDAEYVSGQTIGVNGGKYI